MARAAVVADRLLASNAIDRYDTAWSAIAEHLYTVSEPPYRQELIRVGWQAIALGVRDGQRQRGYREGYDGYSSSGPTMPRFVRYWGPGVTSSHEERVVENIAIRQIMAALTSPALRDAVMALAVHDDYAAAADALGIESKALRARLITARRRLVALWHEGETPCPRRPDRRVETREGLSTHCPQGHEWTPENTRVQRRTVRGKPTHARRCRACQRDRDHARRAVA
jgi:hypothetical protein